MVTLYTVRITTTTQGGDLSYGARLQVTTTIYAFSDLLLARTCLLLESERAEQARLWPGVDVDVELESVPSAARMDAAALRG